MNDLKNLKGAYSKVSKYFYKNGESVYITQGYKDTDPTYPANPHTGLDMRARTPLELISPLDGVVIGVVNHSPKDGYGNFVQVYLPQLDVTLHLAHLSKVNVKVGDKVTKGQTLGFTGNTGNSKGAHLHVGAKQGRNASINKYDNGKWLWICVEDLDFNASSFIEEKGYQIVTNRLIEKRDNPSVSNPGKLVDVPKGTTLEVVGYKHSEGFLWRKLRNGQWISTGPSNSVYDWAKLEPVKKDEQPKPKPPVTSGRQIGSTVVVNGKLFGNSSASSTGSVVHKNKKATIDKIVDDAKAPYHVTGAGLSGWGNDLLFGGIVVETPKFKPYTKHLQIGTKLYKDNLKTAFSLPIRAARTVTIVEEKAGFGKFEGGLVGTSHAWVKL